MYHSYVVPIMDYGSGVWGYHNSEAGDKIQFRAIRYFLGIHPKSPLLALEGDMGWNSCKIRQLINMICVWNRLINMDENRLTKRVFKWDYIIYKNMCFEVKEIFSSIQLQRIYDDMNECSLNTIECNLTEHRNNQWKELLTPKPKLCTYMKFKDNIYTEKYVQYCSFNRRRSLLAQF